MTSSSFLQILSTWDAIEFEETCAEHHGLPFLSTWLGRQKVKRTWNVDKEKEEGRSSRKRKTSVNLALITLPFAELSPSNSNDDVQKLWRFANIIECRKEETNETSKELRSLTSVGRTNTEHMETDSAEEIEHKRSENPEKYGGERIFHGSQPNFELKNEKYNDSEESSSEDMEHSHHCELHGMSFEKEKNLFEIKYKTLESTIHHMNRKLEILENKVDTILHLLQKQPATTSS